MGSTTETAPRRIITSILVISDTHGLQFSPQVDWPAVDVAVHCGDITDHSKLDEFRSTIELMKSIPAKLKLIIAGNHDFSLDKAVLGRKLDEAKNLHKGEIDDDLIRQEYGDDGAPLALLQAAAEDKIFYLEEGSHDFRLENGAKLKVFASPYTPDTGGDWGFQYHDHDFSISRNTDVVITHGPPHGIMDMTSEKQRVGCKNLFASVAVAQPKLHCFGHVHNGWGAKLVAWREKLSEVPSHFSDIDNSKSSVISNLTKLAQMQANAPSTEDSDGTEKPGYYETSHCSEDQYSLNTGNTLFVNAANKGEEGLTQIPWLVNLELDPHDSAREIDCAEKPKKRKSVESPEMASCSLKRARMF